MQRLISVTITACLLTAGAAQAQDKPKPDTGAARTAPEGRPVERAAEHVERAGSELKQAGKAAGDEAQEAARGARDQASDTVRKAQEGAGDAIEQARKQAASSAEEAERVAREAGEQARTGLEQARAKAVSLFDEAREHVRRALLNAASSLESEERQKADEAKHANEADKSKVAENEREHEREHEREKARTQRQEVARVEQWRALRERLPATTTTDGEPRAPRIDPALTNELRIHAQRTARLARIRALADQAKDSRSVSRADALLATELARHEQAMTTLLNRTDTNAQGKALGESKP